MILSRVELNPVNRATLRLLSSPHCIHGAVESCFPGERKRRLWRIDPLNGKWYLLILSDEEGDFSKMAFQYGFPGEEGSVVSKPYDPFLDRLNEGMKLRFRLKANPVRSDFKQAKGGRGKVRALTVEQQGEWLISRAEKLGFSINPEEFEVIHSEWQHFAKNRKHKVSMKTATFEGVLTVVDGEAFRKTLVDGVGRAKAYGCGLMTVSIR